MNVWGLLGVIRVIGRVLGLLEGYYGYWNIGGYWGYGEGYCGYWDGIVVIGMVLWLLG